MDTSGAEEEADNNVEMALDMEVDGGGEGEEEGEGTLRSLEATEFLSQYAEPSGTTLVDSRNGFNKLSRVALLWTVRHRWLAGSRSVFNC